MISRSKAPMQMLHAIALVERVVSTSISHYRTVNESTRKTEAKAGREAYNAVSNVLRELTGEQPTETEVNSALGII